MKVRGQSPHKGPARPRLGEALVAAGVISREQLERALAEQSSWGGLLGQNLLALGYVGEPELAVAIANQFDLPLADLERAPPSEADTKLLPVTLAERYGVVSIGVVPAEGRILIACFDPTNNEAMSEVRRATGLVPEPAVATPSQIEAVIRRNYYGETTPSDGLDPRLSVTRTVATASEGIPRERLPGSRDLVVRLVDLIEPGRHGG
jgi:type IV pilus assembly protein PilB